MLTPDQLHDALTLLIRQHLNEEANEMDLDRSVAHGRAAANLRLVREEIAETLKGCAGVRVIGEKITLSLAERSLCDTGHPIKAIQSIVARADLSLRDAKEAVDTYMKTGTYQLARQAAKDRGANS